jgi:hypothetical protein
MSTEPRPRALGLRPRHARRVAAGHVGRRVSVRRWVQDPDRGPVQADSVGRLVAWEDDDTLVLVDREGRGTRVPAADVLSSRVVPEHPRMEPEPTDAGTRERPLREEVVRILLAADDRLLLRGVDDHGRTRWAAPGAVLPRRTEPAELVGRLRDQLGRPTADDAPHLVLTRSTRRRVGGTWWTTSEGWYLLRTDGPTGTEADPELAWHHRRDLDDLHLDPADLAPRLAGWLRDGPPAHPDHLEDS